MVCVSLHSHVRLLWDEFSNRSPIYVVSIGNVLRVHEPLPCLPCPAAAPSVQDHLPSEPNRGDHDYAYGWLCILQMCVQHHQVWRITETNCGNVRVSKYAWINWVSVFNVGKSQCSWMQAQVGMWQPDANYPRPGRQLCCWSY